MPRCAPAPATGRARRCIPTTPRAAGEWQHTLYEGGWGAITWPVEYGGRGDSAWHQAIFNQEAAKYDVSTGVFSVGIGMCGPTLIAHGSEAQKQRFLPAMLRGEEVWCQLFSEPDAGSDLAGLKTRARRDGDVFVVNGQKVWTSGAQYSDWGILVARTNADVPKHKGITYFLVDMRTPGIEIRPLRQITGDAHFNEEFLTDVAIPAENVVGTVDHGWAVTHTTMGNERALIGGAGGGGVTVTAAGGLRPPGGQEQGPGDPPADRRLLYPDRAPAVHELPGPDGAFPGPHAGPGSLDHQAVHFAARQPDRRARHGALRGPGHAGGRRARPTKGCGSAPSSTSG